MSAHDTFSHLSVLYVLTSVRTVVISLQGVGKSSALQAIYVSRIEAEEKALKHSRKPDNTDSFPGTVLFKWRREPELFKSLLDATHELSRDYEIEYRYAVWKRLLPLLTDLEKREQHDPGTLDLRFAEARLGRSVAEELRREAWLRILISKRVLLIDTPDYSKTDRRLMAKDLEGIYWIWNFVIRHNAEANIVVAIQKEMFRDHFFFDKMEKVELEPLKPQQMVEAYRKRFKVIDPFTEDALLNLARMSRGIFRRFLRYITLTLRRWEICGKRTIDTAIVKEAIPVARLAEDMELELAELFPKHSDLRLLAVRLLMLLEESGERKQIELAELLEVEPYVLSRLLTKLEVAHYITRRRVGNDKIVDLRIARNSNQTPQVLDRAIEVV